MLIILSLTISENMFFLTWSRPLAIYIFYWFWYLHFLLVLVSLRSFSLFKLIFKGTEVCRTPELGIFHPGTHLNFQIAAGQYFWKDFTIFYKEWPYLEFSWIFKEVRRWKSKTRVTSCEWRVQKNDSRIQIQGLRV